MKKSTNRNFSEIEDKVDNLEDKVNHLEKKILYFTKWAWVFVFLGIIIVFFGITYYLNPYLSEKVKLSELGDFYGGTVASLWTLAGLFFIYVAFLGQKQQLINQEIELLYNKVELKLSRAEIKEHTKELIEQNKTFRIQRFENTFFQLMKNYNSIVNSLIVGHQNPTTGEFVPLAKGRNCFRLLYNEFKESFKLQNDSKVVVEKSDSILLFEKFYLKNQSYLGPWLFRSMGATRFGLWVPL